MRVLILAFLCLLSGCYAGTAALVLGILELTDDQSGSSPVDVPPGLTNVRIAPASSPDRILVEFRVTNEDAGRLSARVEWVKMEAALDGEFRPAGPPAQATPAPGSGVPENLPPREVVRFVWDAGKDLAGEAAAIQFVLTPMEDGVEGEAFRTEVLRAGNTPVAAQNFILASQANQIVATFELVDGESDVILLIEVAISVNGGEPVSLPAFIFEKLRRDFPSAPAPSGTRGGLIFLVDELDQEGVPDPLRELGRAGYVGDLTFRLSFQDYPDELPFVAEATFRFDNNLPPSLEIISATPEDLADGGVFPIHYRVSDPDGNPADLTLEVDLGDGKGFRPANELPREPSEGRTGIDARDSQRVHTFLWDALTQPSAAERATLRLSVRDREVGETREIEVSGFSSSGLLKVSDLPSGLKPTAATSGDFDGDGVGDLAVANEISDTVTFYQGGAGGPRRAADLPAGRQPRAILANDFDGDAFSDAVTAEWGAASLTLLRGGPGGLSADRRTTIPVEGGPVALAAADFNGDGLPDLAVANYFHGSISYLEAADDGLSELRKRTLTVGRGPVALASADYDSDGFFSDLAVANELSDSVTVFLGGFEGLTDLPARRSSTSVGKGPRALASGDFDNDLRADLGVANWGAGTVSYLRGTASGLELARTILVGSGPSALLSGDFDGNSPPMDLAVASELSGEATILIGGIDGLSAAAARRRVVASGASPQALATGDFDGDANADLVVANRGSGTIAFLTRSTGPEWTPKRISVGTEPQALTAGDYNGDGFFDVAVANAGSGTVSYLAGGRGGPALAAKAIPARAEPRALASADYDRDGFPDLAVACASLTSDPSGNLVFSAWIIRLLGGASGPGEATELEVINDPRVLVSGDFDQDGFPDLVVTGPSSPPAFIPGSREGFRAPVRLNAGPGRAVSEGDLDGDGFPDLLLANTDLDRVRYVRGGLTGLSPGSKAIQVGSGPRAIAIGNLDGDRFPDALVANGGSANISFLRGSGDGPENAGEFPAALGPIALDLADFNGDGFPDAAAACTGAGAVTFLRGSSGGLKPGGEIAVGLQPRAILHGDWNADGFPDLLVANGGSDTVHLLEGGLPGLSGDRLKTIPTGESPIDLASGDFDGDGFLDVLVANLDSNNLTQLRGGPGGLEREADFASGLGPRVLLTGDFQGDGFSDLVAANGNSDDLTFLRQRYLTPHASAFIDPDDPSPPSFLVDPRDPPGYRLDLPPETFRSPTQVCLLPSLLFELPQGEFAKVGKFLAARSDCVAILDERTELPGETRLTLRLRKEDGDLGSLVVLRKDLRTGIGAVLPLTPGALQVVDLAGGKAVSFPILGFGSYVVAEVMGR